MDDVPVLFKSKATEHKTRCFSIKACLEGAYIKLMCRRARLGFDVNFPEATRTEAQHE